MALVSARPGAALVSATSLRICVSYASACVTLCAAVPEPVRLCLPVRQFACACAHVFVPCRVCVRPAVDACVTCTAPARASRVSARAPVRVFVLCCVCVCVIEANCGRLCYLLPRLR